LLATTLQVAPIHTNLPIASNICSHNASGLESYC
jgi:hypothetical protein